MNDDYNARVNQINERRAALLPLLARDLLLYANELTPPPKTNNAPFKDLGGWLEINTRAQKALKVIDGFSQGDDDYYTRVVMDAASKLNREADASRPGDEEAGA